MDQKPDHDDIARRGKAGYNEALAKAIEEATANKEIQDPKAQRTLIDVEACDAVFKRKVRKQNVRMNADESKRPAGRPVSVAESRYEEESGNKTLAYLGGAVALIIVAVFSIFVVMHSVESGKQATPAADQSAPPVVAK